MSAESLLPASRLVYEKKKSVQDRCTRLAKAIQFGGGNSHVAKATGIPKPTLSTYASGRDMKASAAVAISAACGVSLEWLLSGEGSMSGADKRHGRKPEGELTAAEKEEELAEARKKPALQARARRLKFAIQRGGGIAVISNRTAIPPRMLEHYMEGGEPPLRELAELAEACNVTLDWLVRGVERKGALPHSFSDSSSGALRPPGPMNALPTEGAGEVMMAVPYFQTEAAAGAAIVSDDWKKARKIPFSRSFIASLLGSDPEGILFMQARGDDSMHPTIRPQDVLIVTCSDHTIRPGVYLMTVGDMILIRRLGIKTTQLFEIVSDNKEYSGFEVPIDSVTWDKDSKEGSIRLLGKITGSIHLDH